MQLLGARWSLGRAPTTVPHFSKVQTPSTRVCTCRGRSTGTQAPGRGRALGCLLSTAVPWRTPPRHWVEPSDGRGSEALFLEITPATRRIQRQPQA